jgi:hypothetical protein
MQQGFFNACRFASQPYKSGIHLGLSKRICACGDIGIHGNPDRCIGCNSLNSRDAARTIEPSGPVLMPSAHSIDPS